MQQTPGRGQVVAGLGLLPPAAVDGRPDHHTVPGPLGRLGDNQASRTGGGRDPLLGSGVRTVGGHDGDQTPIAVDDPALDGAATGVALGALGRGWTFHRIP